MPNFIYNIKSYFIFTKTQKQKSWTKPRKPIVRYLVKDYSFLNDEAEIFLFYQISNIQRESIQQNCENR